MRKLRLNRKGIIEDYIPLIVFLIVMSFIIIFFVTYKSEQKSKIQKTFLEDKEWIDANQILLNYLRLYSDLIILRLNDISYEKELREKTEEYFNEIYGDKWRLKIWIYEYGKLFSDYPSVKVDLPYFDKNIEVFFYYE